MPSVVEVDAGNRKQTFQGLLDAIREEFERKENQVDVGSLWQILEEYESNPSEWSKFAFYDKYRYKRNLIDDHQKYNVMILGWAPGVKSNIHDHSGSQCLVKVLEGEVLESRFEWPEDCCKRMSDGSPCTCKEMNLISESRHIANDILYMHDKVGLHRMGNPNSNQTCATLHIYIPPFRRCKIFDQKTGKSQVCKMVFHSKRGQLIKEEEDL